MQTKAAFKSPFVEIFFRKKIEVLMAHIFSQRKENHFELNLEESKVCKEGSP